MVEVYGAMNMYGIKVNADVGHPVYRALRAYVLHSELERIRAERVAMESGNVVDGARMLALLQTQRGLELLLDKAKR